jgi:hypothetical protein
MTSLGFSSVNSANVLQHNIAGGANPSNAHFTNAYGSIVGGVSGCGGAGGSAAALAGKSGYNIEAMQSGGTSQRRGGYKKRGQNKKGQSNKRCKCRGKCHCRKSNKRRHCNCRGKCHCKRSNKRTMRGGMASLSPAPFSGGANAPHHQFMSGQPTSYNFGIGSRAPIPLNLIGTATPGPMMDIHNNCGSNHGMVSKGLML